MGSRKEVFRLPYQTKFRRTIFSPPSRNFNNFVRFLPDFCIVILDKIFKGQNFSSNKIFDTKLKFRQFCPTNFRPIRYGNNDEKLHSQETHVLDRPWDYGNNDEKLHSQETHILESIKRQSFTSLFDQTFNLFLIVRLYNGSYES